MKRSVLPASHRWALQATARVCGVALATSVGGCAGAGGNAGASKPGSAAGVEREPAQATRLPAAAEPEPEATSPTQSELYEVAAEPATPSAEARLVECRAMTGAAFADPARARARKPRQEVIDCCRTVAEHYSEKQLDRMGEWKERDACCSALEWREGGMACAPWGPTAPPSALGVATAFDDAGDIDLRPQARSLRREHLPELDATSLDAGLRYSAISTWRERMLNEWVSARVFAALAEQMDAAGFDANTVDTWAAFADEERQHGRLCAAVVDALGGEARCERPPLPRLPRHADVDAKQGVLRNVLSISCLSETVAVALIGAEREQMPPGPLRELLTRIWADEIGHANEGWRLLRRELSEAADPSGHRREDLRRYLPVALADMYAHELEHMPTRFVSPPGGERWGLCDTADARALLDATLQRVIAPGLGALLA